MARSAMPSAGWATRVSVRRAVWALRPSPKAAGGNIASTHSGSPRRRYATQRREGDEEVAEHVQPLAALARGTGRRPSRAPSAPARRDGVGARTRCGPRCRRRRPRRGGRGGRRGRRRRPRPGPGPARCGRRSRRGRAAATAVRRRRRRRAAPGGRAPGAAVVGRRARGAGRARPATRRGRGPARHRRVYAERTAWKLVPPKPKALTPARRSSSIQGGRVVEDERALRARSRRRWAG